MHLNMLRMVSDLRVASDFLPESVFIVYGFLCCCEEKSIYDAAFNGKFLKFDLLMKHVLLPDAGQRSLPFFLAMEEYVAGKYDGEAFFVWRVAPTVIIGRNQVLENEVNMEYCRERGVDVVRRRSGGGCVYSDKGNIMVSYISRRGDVAEVFERYLSALTEALRSLGLPAERTGRNDVLVDGRKVSGNAFHMLPDRSIVHGTLLYSTDLEAMTEAIRPPVEKLQRHGVESVRQRVMNISELVESMEEPHEALRSVEALEKYLVGYFTDGEIALEDDDVVKINNMI